MAATAGSVLRPVALRRPVVRHREHHGLPVYLAFLGFPIWWALGIGPFIWPILAIPMGIWLVTHRGIRIPKGFGLWVLFLLWTLGSATQLQGSDRWIPFAYRLGLYGAATVFLLYVLNAPRRFFSDRAVVFTMAGFWAIVAIGGLAGVVLPHFGFQSLFERLLPARLAQNAYVHDLVHPSLAQISTFLGFAHPRPKAPFEYANDWGAVYALTVPFAVMALRMMRSSIWRLLLRGLLLASVIPVVDSLDRGLWLSLAVAVAYAGFRLATGRQKRAVVGIAAMVAFASVVIMLSPLRGVIAARFAHPHSNEGRSTLYAEAISGAAQHPLLGWGSPRPSDINPNLPSVGTQGQFWLVLYSQGIVGALFFLGWYVVTLVRTRKPMSHMAFWCHVIVLISFVQLAFYGQLPAQIQITMVAIALIYRERNEADAAMKVPA